MPHLQPPSSDPYQQRIIDRHKQPLHQGNLINPTHQLDLVNTLCGDSIHLDLIVEDGKISQVAWTGQGCAISTTATDILIDHIRGLTPTQLAELTDRQFLDILNLDLRPSRLKCALLGLNCLRQVCLSDEYENVYE